MVVELVANPLMTSDTFTQASLAHVNSRQPPRAAAAGDDAASFVRADIRRLLRRSSVLTVGVTGYVTFGT